MNPSAETAGAEGDPGAGGWPRVRTTRVHYRAGARGVVPASRLFCDPATDGVVEPELVFGRVAPCVLDVGFGKGETLAEMAALNPQLNFIGCELFEPGLRALAHRADREGLDNLRLAFVDARDLLQKHLKPGALTGVCLFFPDPWPKRRHHKRRLVQPEFAALVRSRLQPGGVLHAVTDWPDYARWIDRHFSTEAGWQQLSGPAPDFPTRPQAASRFQARGLKAGRPATELWFRRL